MVKRAASTSNATLGVRNRSKPSSLRADAMRSLRRLSTQRERIGGYTRGICERSATCEPRRRGKISTAHAHRRPCSGNRNSDSSEHALRCRE
jgi:hypothetical protein